MVRGAIQVVGGFINPVDQNLLVIHLSSGSGGRRNTKKGNRNWAYAGIEKYTQN